MDFNKLFNNFDEADASSGGRTPKINVAGDFVCKIESVKIKESDQFNAVYFIVEFEVLYSSHESISKGSHYAWTNDLLNKFFGMSSTKNFMAAAIGVDPDTDDAKGISKENVKDAASDEQPLTGSVVLLRTQPKTAKSGNPFTVHSWKPAPEDVLAQLEGN